METEAIVYFLTVAQCLNFSEAAEECHISQSSFSKAIMRLEKDLDVRLIDRSTHPIRLTEAGNAFYQDMCRLRPQYQEALKRLESFAEKRRLHVLICPKSYAFRAALQDFMGAFPKDIVDYDQSSEYHRVTEQMLEGSYDFCITPRPMVLPPTLKSTELYRDAPYLLAGSGTDLAKQDSVSVRDLNGLDFCESPFSWYLVRELVRYFGFSPRSVYPDEEGTEKHLVTREEAIHRVARGQAFSIYCGRDVSIFKDARIRFLPIREVPELPVVLLEKTGAGERPEKADFRKWVLSSLESYVLQPLQ